MPNRYNSLIAKTIGHFNKSSEFAITINQTTFYSTPKSVVDDAPHWRCHEDRHKEQWVEFGVIGFIARYIYYTLVYGYKNNPLELDAEAHAYDFKNVPNYKQKEE